MIAHAPSTWRGHRDSKSVAKIWDDELHKSTHRDFKHQMWESVWVSSELFCSQTKRFKQAKIEIPPNRSGVSIKTTTSPAHDDWWFWSCTACVLVRLGLHVLAHLCDIVWSIWWFSFYGVCLDGVSTLLEQPMGLLGCRNIHNVRGWNYLSGLNSERWF